MLGGDRILRKGGVLNGRETLTPELKTSETKMCRFFMKENRKSRKYCVYLEFGIGEENAQVF